MAGELHKEVIEALYREALVLADDARSVFDLCEGAAARASDDAMRIAMSIEGLRTTTRVMHVLAWLLNQRALQAGEMSEAQALRSGRLADSNASDPMQLQLLELETRALIRETERLYDRVARLDAEWRAAEDREAPVRAMQGRIAEAFGTGNTGG